MDIENWIGTVSIKGEDLTAQLEKHLRAYAGEIVDIKIKEKAIAISKNGEIFTIKTDKSEYQTKTVLITTGSMREQPTIPGADKFDNRGISYCATCDAPLFSDMDVAVVGGGNSAFESAAQLLAYAKSITILQRSELKANRSTASKTLLTSVLLRSRRWIWSRSGGDQFVTSLVYKDKKSGETKELPA